MEIKVCKCGGTPEVVKIFPKNRQDCFVRCPECGSETKCYTSRQNAVKMWNEWKLVNDPIKDMEGVILRIFDEDYTRGFEPSADITAEGLFIAGYRKQKVATWIYDPNGNDWGLGAWVCSECHGKNDNLGMSENINPYIFVGSKWCPTCGAKMGGKKILAEKYHVGDTVYVIVENDIKRKREVVSATVEEIHTTYPYSVLVKQQRSGLGSHSILLSTNACDERLFVEESLAIRKLLEMGETIDG